MEEKGLFRILPDSYHEKRLKDRYEPFYEQPGLTAPLTLSVSVVERMFIDQLYGCWPVPPAHSRLEPCFATMQFLIIGILPRNSSPKTFFF